MGYYLQTIICKQEDALKFSKELTETFIKQINFELCLIPMTEKLYDEINNFKVSEQVGDFEYLTTNIEDKLLKISNGIKYAYVEADYHGGTGGQVGILWDKGERILLLNFGQDRINEILRSFGVKATDESDEFLVAGFAMYRSNQDLIV